MSHPPMKMLQALRPERELTIILSRATAARIRAQMGRVERDSPGLAYAPGESADDSLRIAVGALLDRALTDSEDDEGLRYDYLTDQLMARPALAWRTRLRRAGRALRGNL